MKIKKPDIQQQNMSEWGRRRKIHLVLQTFFFVADPQRLSHTNEKRHFFNLGSRCKENSNWKLRKREKKTQNRNFYLGEIVK